MKFNLRWYTSNNKFYAPLCEGEGYIPTFYLVKNKNRLKFIEIRMIHSAIKEQYIEVYEENGDDSNGYTGGGKEKDKCNRIVNLHENHRDSISSLFENSR